MVDVAKLVIFAAPQGAGQTNGPWLVAAAAVDTSGNPIPGLPVTFDAKAGTFGTNQGVTDSLGTFSTGYLPPSLSTSSQTDILTATTGSQTAVAVVSFAPPPNTLATTTQLHGALRLSIAGSDAPADSQTFNASVAAFGVSGARGSTTPFAFLTPDQQQCLSGDPSTPIFGDDCIQTLSQNGISVSQPNILGEVCSIADILGTIEGTASCVG
ncbi:MAG: Ig-like domain-containing protein, partial [Candidatus Binatales bacterium]